MGGRWSVPPPPKSSMWYLQTPVTLLSLHLHNQIFSFPLALLLDRRTHTHTRIQRYQVHGLKSCLETASVAQRVIKLSTFCWARMFIAVNEMNPFHITSCLFKTHFIIIPSASLSISVVSFRFSDFVKHCIFSATYLVSDSNNFFIQCAGNVSDTYRSSTRQAGLSCISSLCTHPKLHHIKGRLTVCRLHPTTNIVSLVNYCSTMMGKYEVILKNIFLLKSLTERRIRIKIITFP
jgi:hypothetical protein